MFKMSKDCTRSLTGITDLYLTWFNTQKKISDFLVALEGGESLNKGAQMNVCPLLVLSEDVN